MFCFVVLYFLVHRTPTDRLSRRKGNIFTFVFLFPQFTHKDQSNWVRLVSLSGRGRDGCRVWRSRPLCPDLEEGRGAQGHPVPCRRTLHDSCPPGSPPSRELKRRRHMWTTPGTPGVVGVTGSCVDTGVRRRLKWGFFFFNFFFLVFIYHKDLYFFLNKNTNL